MMVKVAADGSQCVKKQPDEIIQEYRLFETDTNLGGLSIENLTQISRREEVEMKSDSIFISEVNAELWDKALATAIGDISNIFYPHLSVVQELIKYTLNSHIIDIGMTKCFFNKLVMFHPPKTDDMKKYYLCFLNYKYLMLNSVKGEEEIGFWCLIDVLTECLSDEKFIKGSTEKSSERGFINMKRENIEDLYKKTLGNEEECGLSAGKKGKMCFDSLPPSDKVQRVLLVLEFLSAILEVDFTERMKESNFVSSSDCFLSGLVWENPEDVGLMNEKVKKIVHMWFVMEKGKFCHNSSVHRNLLTLLSEVIRSSDDIEGFYPFLGHKSYSFADEVVLQIGDRLKEGMTAVRMVKPHWLRMLVCARLLSRITGKSHPPELTTAHDILKYATKILGKNDNYSKDKRIRGRRISGDVKSCVCRTVKSKRAKLSVELDANSYNDRGWTVLHEAVLNGHEKCVEKLLKDDKRTPIDGRRKGANGFTPLMCAVLTDHAGISRRLLEHFGGELLTDVDNSGRTPMDLCRSKDVHDLMETFESDISIGRDELESCVDLSVQLVVSYFITHRTLDLWKCRSRMKKTQTKSAIRWDRVKYETDVRINIDKLTDIVTKIMEINELTRFVEPLRRVLSFKNCL